MIMPNPASFKEVYKRVHGEGQRLRKKILIISLKHPQAWLSTCKEQEQIKEDKIKRFDAGMSGFIYDLENNLLKN